MKKLVLFAVFAAISISWSADTPKIDSEKDFQQAKASMSAAEVLRIVKEISADSMQGRQPFTPSEEKSINYLKNEFQKLGLEPAFKGSYFQDVPLIQVRSTPVDQAVTIKTKNGPVELKVLDDLVALSRWFTDTISLQNSELVFCGYGVNAPEQKWNDYAALSVKGKTPIVLVNDPGFMTKDSALFKGNAMTYYGRWTYKYEEASRQGANGCIIIHAPDAAGYPFAVVQRSFTGPQLCVDTPDKNKSRPKVEAWITWDAADKLFKQCGLNLSELATAANKPNFKAVPLNAQFSMKLTSTQKKNVTKNVAAILKGTTRADECIVYSAHWDHLGIGTAIEGDSIYNGAVDNGTSLAWMLEVAKAFTKLQQKPKRSILFLAPTAEESGLVGSAYYVDHPVFAPKKTVANFNNDLIYPIGKYKDVMITGWGQSELEDMTAEAAKEQDRYLIADPNAQTGMYYRSDHYNFARVGIPALYARGAVEHREKGKAYAAEKDKEYIGKAYHKPQDQFNEATWNVDNVIEDAQLVFRVGYNLAMSDKFPKWKETSEFKKIRDKQ
ncbi:MAG: M28 family peptidase [Chitinivibrionales bacterium]|nr:M28 family peptidase [Chitinivibrionales bacterium]